MQNVKKVTGGNIVQNAPMITSKTINIIARVPQIQKLIASFLSDIDQDIFLPEISDTIYRILTGYKSTMHLKFPDELLQDLHGKDRIETYQDPKIVNPPINLQNHTWLDKDPKILLNKLKQEVANGCSQCVPCFEEYSQISHTPIVKSLIIPSNFVVNGAPCCVFIFTRQGAICYLN